MGAWGDTIATTMSSTLPLVIGIGNVFRRDDALGPLAARLVVEAAAGLCTACEMDGEGADLMELWAGRHFVVVIDAIRSNGEPGTLVRLDATATAIPPGRFRCSSHAFGLAEAVELSRLLGRLPARLIIHGVEGSAFTFGQGLSPRVETALPLVVAAVVDELRQSSPTQGNGRPPAAAGE